VHVSIPEQCSMEEIWTEVPVAMLCMPKTSIVYSHHLIRDGHRRCFYHARFLQGSCLSLQNLSYVPFAG
jgi:hypothetical protein